jgi:hypothetical protein
VLNQQSANVPLSARHDVARAALGWPSHCLRHNTADFASSCCRDLLREMPSPDPLSAKWVATRAVCPARSPDTSEAQSHAWCCAFSSRRSVQFAVRKPATTHRYPTARASLKNIVYSREHPMNERGETSQAEAHQNEGSRQTPQQRAGTDPSHLCLAHHSPPSNLGSQCF